MPVFEPKNDSLHRIVLKESERNELIKSFDFVSNTEDVDFYIDTEYTQKQKMIVDCIGIRSPQLQENYCIVFPYEELTKDFHPVENFLKAIGNKATVIDEELLNEIEEDFGKLQDVLIDETKPGKAIKQDFEKAKSEGLFDEFLEKHKLSKDYISLSRKHKQSNLTLQPRKLKINFNLFFGQADLAKLGGDKYQKWLLSTKLSQYRCLRFMSRENIYTYIDGILYEIQIVLRDTMYRFPPKNKSLDGQSKTFGLELAKFDLDMLKAHLGLSEDVNVKENMTLIRETSFEFFTKYNAVDIFLTEELDKIQRKFLSIIRSSFDLEDTEIKDTTGNNVAIFIFDCIVKLFNAEDKESRKLLNSAIKLSKIENLQDIILNDFGIKLFQTVGGLLATRTAKHPYIEGDHGDLDLKSCYAAAMSNMNIYLGEPVTLTFKYEKYKPTLREIFKFIDEKNPPDDGWFVRVSGKLTNAINTLVLSDLRFNSKAEKMPTKYDLNKNKKSVEYFNAEKTGKKQASSTILLKEIKFGYINKDIREALKLLPEEWYEEYLDLKCDGLVYIPKELIANDLKEYEELQKGLPEEQCAENFNPKKGVKEISGHYHKANVCLKFYIGEYWEALASKRSEFKKAKNPVQEVYKLFCNSGYGVLACLFLAVNNLVASNYITAKARVSAWMMINALNGFAVITDGCCYNQQAIPINQRFKDLLAQNPEYLIDYNPDIKSGLKDGEVNQKWIDKNFKAHLAKFFNLEESHYLIQQFGYELKTEKFVDKKGKEIETTRFTKYYNTNAGNYIKGLKEGSLLIEENDYDFSSQESNIKARSFRGDDDVLLNWYISSLHKYENPLIYSEKEIVKFGDAIKLSIKYLEDTEEICFPMGFTKQSYKMMKLISRSQFLFLNEAQLRNFETNENNLSELTKFIFNKQFWDTLKPSELAEYKAELREGVNYHDYARTHTVGVGFELLALTKKYKGSIQAIRELIYTHILEGCTNFNAKLNINKYFENAESFKYLLASVIILKKNAEDDLKKLLIASTSEPTLLKVKPENIKTLEQLWESGDED